VVEQGAGELLLTSMDGDGTQQGYDLELTAAGRPVRMIGTNWDVTEQKQLENNVKSSEENFRTFFQTVDDMIVVATPEGRILFTNNAFNQKLGYTHEELKAMKVLDIHPAECREEAESILGAMLCGKRDFCPLPLQMKGGRRLPAETRVWLGKWNGEECIFGISKDLSEQQAALTTFEKVFHSNPALMAISSLPEKKFIDVNSSFLKRLGFTREEVIGKTVDELGLFVDPVSQATIATELERRGRVVGVDVSLRDKYGEMADGLFFGEIIDSHGKTVFLTVIADLTALKQAESALIHTERMSNLLMELAAQHINIPLAEVDAAIRLSLKKMGSFISADRAYVFRYDFFRKTTCNEYEWCHDDIAPQIEQLQDVPLEGIPDWVSAHENGRYLYIEDVKALPRGNLRDILEPQGIKSLITVPMMSNGVCIGFVGFDSVRRRHSYSTKEIALLTLFSQILVNVKSRARAQNDLVMTNQQLETATARADALAAQATQASTAKTTFLAHMSHEIRTPLNAILGFSQLLQYDPDLTLRQKQRVETINRSGEHLLALLNDILELSKIEAGGLTAVPTTFDLQSLLSDLAMVFRIRAEAKNLTLQTDGLDGVPFFITTDEQKLRQVLINLLSNAVKYTRKGGIWLRLAIAQEGTDDLRLVIQVEDTGLGITAEEMGTLFMAFEQASAGRKSGTGTGLGLAISRQFARLMGGDVTVTSQTDKGSIFCLDIPVKSGNTSLRTNKIDMRQVLRLEADHPRYRILVVDDNDDSRHLLTQMLGNVGFEVLMASDGREALAVFTQQHPQLILMDDGMPVMCGDDAIRKIRQSPGGTDVRIMTLTANASDETRHRTIAAGADAFMAKPFRTTTLFENIHRLSGIRYVYDELETSTAASPEQARVMTQEMMTTLPIELRQQIRAATISGRHGQLLTLVQQVAAIKPEMGETLRNMVTAFDYERLIQLLN
jgi:PAS domain S-box-containing protein